MVVCLLAAAGPARALTIVSPSGYANLEGPAGNGAPFDVGSHTHRYQQVYAATEFVGIDSPMLVTQIAFRPNYQGNAFDTTLTSVQISMSTTSLAPDGLSTTFADNVGDDETVVFPQGPLHLTSDFTGPAAGPKDFDVVIDLPTPFLYDPTLGNLLLEVRNFGGGTTGPFDSVNASDGVSRLITLMSSGSVDSATGSTDSGGLPTQFTFAPVPEPASGMLLAAGLPLGVALARRVRRRWSREQ